MTSYKINVQKFYEQQQQTTHGKNQTLSPLQYHQREYIGIKEERNNLYNDNFTFKAITLKKNTHSIVHRNRKMHLKICVQPQQIPNCQNIPEQREY